MRIHPVRSGLVSALTSAASERTGRLRWSGRPLDRRWTALLAALVAAFAVVTDELRPQPWQLHLLAPLIAALVGWSLAARFGTRPQVVLGGLLGLFVGASAAQRLESYWLVLPMAVAGCLLGVLLTTGSSSDTT